MELTEFKKPMSFSLWAKNWAKKEQSVIGSAQFSTSCRRSGCSPAEPYPPHEWTHSSTPVRLPYPKGTFLLWNIGDISTLG
jgi:hypothetical protein